MGVVTKYREWTSQGCMGPALLQAGGNDERKYQCQLFIAGQRDKRESPDHSKLGQYLVSDATREGVSEAIYAILVAARVKLQLVDDKPR